MVNAKNYPDYLKERQVALDETIAELGLKAGSREVKALEVFAKAIDRQHELVYAGDRLSLELARQESTTFSRNFYAQLEREKWPDQTEAMRASAHTIEAAVNKFSGKLRGPSIIDRVAVEPYYDKKEGIKPPGLAALAGGLGLGALIASWLGGFGGGGMGLLGSIATVLVTGLAVGGLLPPAIDWIRNKLDDKSPDAGSKSPEVAPHAPARTAEKSEEKSSPARESEPSAYASTEHMPEQARAQAVRAARRSITTLGGPGNGAMPNVSHAHPYKRWAQYGATIYSPTGVPPRFAYANTGNYGHFTGYTPAMCYGNGYGCGGLGTPPMFGAGSFMTNGGYGLNANVRGRFGLSNNYYVPPNQFAGFNSGNLPQVNGVRYDESAASGMNMRGHHLLSHFNPNAYNPLAIQPENSGENAHLPYSRSPHTPQSAPRMY